MFSASSASTISSREARKACSCKISTYKCSACRSGAAALSPGVTGEHLFDDYRSKVENSHTLYRELHALLRKVSNAERSSGILLKHSLVRHLEHFREETMPFLMYKDWGAFGRYVDDVKRAFEDMEEFESVLHEFSQYLSTLIHHVGMREVLRNWPPVAGQGEGSGV